ncbi:MAG: bifunctional phosphopantothenoylcysteine decarboxylase/phosphopantothenate--cysteine ligase CoaBC [Duodenibacillus sp.]|nr:bifunctional phosphopantothenoylcysteine decarboxylase/phosphopantothenate--cysteine ligase CoaBC [Duodenibacillus sp.]
MTTLASKHITLVVTGGIAAYKSCELVRRLRKEGAAVRVVMTRAATEFVGALTFEALSGHPVAVSQFDGTMPHLSLSDTRTDLIVVAPATANMLAKIANGIADDLASSLILGRTSPLMVAPAMNTNMWNAAPTRRNIETLKADGVHVVGPACGELACGVNAVGRMSEPGEIVEAIQGFFTPKVLAGRRVVLTAGPTYEAIDPIRGITNRSSGKQGYAIALAAQRAGADVTLISGPTALPRPTGCRVIDVTSAQDMYEAVMAACDNADVFISVAAVADWRVESVAEHKIKKAANAQPVLSFVENPDIVASVAALPNRPYCVGFAAETQQVEQYAQDKLAKKKLDLIVANDARRAIGTDINRVLLIDAEKTEGIGPADKHVIARALIERIARDLL